MYCMLTYDSFVALLALQDTDNDGNPKRIDDLCVFRHDVLFVAKDGDM